MQAVTHLVFGEKLWCEGPGRITHHLVHVAAVCDSVVSLLLVHHCEALEFVCEFVTAHFTHTPSWSYLFHTNSQIVRV